MNGIMMGLTPREARKRYESVIDFAELTEFEDLKLKNYSSGMNVRLAFSVAIQVDADILLIDEVLAVGDAAFQQKCFDVFHRMRDEGKTIVFVTHDMSALNRFCHRAMLLERGSIVELGEPQEVGDRYLEINFGRDDEAGGAVAGGEDGEARVVEAWVEDERGERLAAAPQGVRITLNGRVTFNVEVDDPQASCVRARRGSSCDRRRQYNSRPPTDGPFPARRSGRLLVHVRERAGAGPLQPDVHACSARIWLGRHRSLRGLVLVRGHGRAAARRCRRSAGRRQRAPGGERAASVRQEAVRRSASQAQDLRT